MWNDQDELDHSTNRAWAQMLKSLGILLLCGALLLPCIIWAIAVVVAMARGAGGE
jgi:hypothetical protein